MKFYRTILHVALPQYFIELCEKMISHDISRAAQSLVGFSIHGDQIDRDSAQKLKSKKSVLPKC